MLVKNMDPSKAMKIKLSDELPPDPIFKEDIRRAPNRGYDLNRDETIIALKMLCDIYLKTYINDLLLNI
ncbi:hypothetical protein ES703_51155 [subsurface metagenome]